MRKLDLTNNQESYSQARADGLNRTEAYRATYSTVNMKSSTLWDNAYTLDRNPKVAARIAELRQATMDDSAASRAWDLDRLVRELSTNVKLARELGQISASNGSLTSIGKALGILVDKVDIDVTHRIKPGLTLEELEERIVRLDALESGVIEGKGTVLDYPPNDEDPFS